MLNFLVFKEPAGQAVLGLAHLGGTLVRVLRC